VKGIQHSKNIEYKKKIGKRIKNMGKADRINNKRKVQQKQKFHR